MNVVADRSTASRLFKSGDFEQAAKIYRELSREPTKDSGLLIDRAACEYKLGNLTEASQLLRQVVEADPRNERAVFDYSWIRFKKRDYNEAQRGFRSISRGSRFYPRILSPLTQTLINLGNLDGAGELLPELKAQDSQSGFFAEGRIAELLNRFDEARLAFEQAFKLIDSVEDESAFARGIEAQSALGSMHLATGNKEKALWEWQQCHQRKRRKFADQLTSSDQYSIRFEKLQSDLEQSLYILESKVDSQLQAYVDCIRELLETARSGSAICVEGRKLRQLRAYLNQPLHLFKATHSVSKALSSAIDWRAIIDHLSRASPRYAIVDDLLSEEALAYLQRFCIESMIWYDDRYENGYLGSYVDDGLASDVLLRVADELRQALSPVLGGRALSKVWAFKYGAKVNGVPPHADFSKWTVNLWLCPDEGNLDPSTGGLKFYNANAPDGLGFHDYNYNTSSGNWLSDTLAKTAAPQVVPHRCNRAAIFDSSVVHATDCVTFDKRYQYRRINVTFSFGYR